MKADFLEEMSVCNPLKSGACQNDLGVEPGDPNSGNIGSCIWGLPMLRWLEQVTMDFSEGSEYFQGVVRETPVTTPFSKMPVDDPTPQ